MEAINFFGATVFVVVMIIFGISYAFFHKGKYRKTLLLILAAGFLLRLFCALDPALHQWDERFHALVAKNVMEEPFSPKLYKEVPLEYDYKHWGKNHIWLHKQPLPFWVMGASLKVFGVNHLALRLPSLLLSTILIAVTFLIGSKLFNDRIGVLAAFFHSVNGLIIEIGSGRVATDHVDLFFFFFIEMAIFFSVLHRDKRSIWNIVLVGLLTGMAVLSKWLPGLIVLPVFVVLNFEKLKIKSVLKDGVMVFFIALIVSLPWQVYAANAFPDEYWWENGYNLMHFNSSIEQHGEPWWYHLINMGRIWNELIFLVLPWFIWKTIKNKKGSEYWALLTWMFLPYLFFSLASTKMQGYVLFTGPVFFIILAIFIEDWSLKANRQSFREMPWVPKVVAVMIVLLALRFGVERVKPFEMAKPNERLDIQLIAIDSYVIGNGPHIVFNSSDYIELMFFTDHLAYEKIPSLEEIQQLTAAGESIVVIDNGDLPEYFRNNKDLQLISLVLE
ncbi:MAG: hypothetical protein DWQ02_18730 [Bacteroidetes bacterium]|nr:MAG: hypothetical protein DWQ02_18730 [Bacteroidota bacterium]